MRRMIRVGATALIAAIALTACSDPTQTAKLAVAHDLKDPDSVKFRDIRDVEVRTDTGSTMKLTCGELNSKNSYGAFAGYSPFYYVQSHSVAGRIAEGAQPRFPAKSFAIGNDETTNEIEAICERKAHIFHADQIDYGWIDPCGDHDNGELGSQSWARWHVQQKYPDACDVFAGTKDGSILASQDRAKVLHALEVMRYSRDQLIEGQKIGSQRLQEALKSK